MTKVLLAAVSILTLGASAIPAQAHDDVDSGLRRGHRGYGRLVCTAQNLNQRVFYAVGRDAVDTQARALGSCYNRSQFLLKGTCIPTGCHRR